jgi:uncharacterized membrane protein YczE
VGGLGLFGAGVGLQKQGAMGLAPWDVFHDGFSKVTGLPFGRALVLTSFLVLFLWIPLRQRVGIGTLLNAVQIGVVADVVIALVPEQTTYWTRVPFMVVGILLVGVGSGFYIGAGLGPGPRDGLMTGLAARGMAISRARTAVEISVLLVGWILGGTVGVGTLAFALSIGPIVGRTIPRLRMKDLDLPVDEQKWAE